MRRSRDREGVGAFRGYLKRLSLHDYPKQGAVSQGGSNGFRDSKLAHEGFIDRVSGCFVRVPETLLNITQSIFRPASRRERLEEHNKGDRRRVRRSVCSIALLLVCLDWKSDSFSLPRPSPLRFQSCNTTFRPYAQSPVAGHQ